MEQAANTFEERMPGNLFQIFSERVVFGARSRDYTGKRVVVSFSKSQDYPGFIEHVSFIDIRFNVNRFDDIEAPGCCEIVVHAKAAIENWAIGSPRIW